VPNVDTANGTTAFQRFGGTAGADGTALIAGGSTSTTTPGTTTAEVSKLSISTSGTPTFAQQPAMVDLPAGRFAAAGAGADGVIYVSGGATTIGPSSGTCSSTRGNMAATSTLTGIGTGLVAAWSTLASMPAARVEHGMVAVETTDGTVDKLYVIGGQTGTGGFGTEVYEYTP
jgi:hypothetical protein